MPSAAQIHIIDIPYPADRAYSYLVPLSMENSVEPGVIVEVPFGKSNRRMTGVVTAYPAELPGQDCKPVTQVFGDGPMLSPDLLELCRFLKEYTLCTYGEAVRAVLPSAAMSKIITYYRVLSEEERTSEVPLKSALSRIGERGQRVYTLAKTRGRFSRQTLQNEVDFNLNSVFSELVKYGLIERCEEVKNASAVKYRRIIAPSESLVLESRLDENYFSSVLSALTGANQKKILEEVFRSGACVDSVLYEKLGIPLQSGRTSAQTLEKRGLIAVTNEEEYRNHFTRDSFRAASVVSGKNGPVTLSPEQQRARDAVVALYESGKPAGALLHGVTGSGKTNVIMAAIDRVLEDGRGVIMLVPEIALTPQTVGIFMNRYGESIAVIHSALSAGEKFDAWRRVRDGKVKVVIGTRSAIFAPFENIGMIIIDEEHEYTYKSDTDPKYQAHDIARKRCADHNAVMLLSSATPSVTSYYKAKTGGYTLVELKERYGNAVLPEVKIYDMRGETAMGNLSPVGGLLAMRLHEDRDAGNQSILFLNRRGYNNYVSCRKCGKSLKCPNCSVTLTYHSTGRVAAAKDDETYEAQRREKGYLTCHMCGYRTKVPEKCPQSDCGSEHFLFMGCGTQKAEDDIADQFPDLRVLRMDLDTTQAKFSHEEILSKFRAGEADVLLGTQMVTKGHDFPRVATVGVLNADGSLMLDDYRASERTFAMLTQVIGRAGRGDIPGCAVIQTYNPDNEVLLMAARQDYPSFFDGEIRLRKAFCFPPFCDIAVITLTCADEQYLNMACVRMRERIIERTEGSFGDVPLVLYGPFEAPVYRVQNTYRMRLVLKCRLNKRTREMLSELLCEFSKFTPGSGGKERNFSKSSHKISVSVDLNPTTV